MTNLLEISHVVGTSVDREAGVIRGVRILGRESKNGRTYSDRALREAAAKYEGVDVNVNHPDRSRPNSERRIEDAIGWLESIDVRRDGVYGDLHYLKGHPSADLIAEAAERRSSRIGLSHNAQGTVVRRDGKNVVESIEQVISVDLVQNPATNAGLFESRASTIRETLTTHAPALLRSLVEDAALLPPESMDDEIAVGAENDPSADVKAALVQMLTAIVEMPGNITAICTQLIDVAQKIIAGQPEPAQGEEAPEDEERSNPAEADPTNPNPDPAAVDSADNPAADDSAKNPFEKRKFAMAESNGKKSVEERLNLLEQENRQLKEELDLRKLREDCEKLLREHRREVTGTRLTALANMPEGDRLQLIEEWPAIQEPEPPARARPKPSFSAPLREKVDSFSYPKDIKSMIDACRS